MLPDFCENGAPLDLTEVPRLTERQRAIVWVTAAAVAATRLYAMSRSLWDWDEALFCSAMRDFDVMHRGWNIVYHPHPPGFPLFIALAHVTRLFARTDFGALQAVSTIAAMLLFPLTFALARSLRMSFAESYAGALILVFLPNVWFYGGTAFSDIAALAAVIGAAAALFASRTRDRRFYFAACLLLGAAIAFRPQNALIGAWPWFVASWERRRMRWLDVIAGAFIVAGATLIAYGGAALASQSVRGYVEAIRAHEHYVSTVDSFRNPERPKLGEAFVLFVVDPFHARKAMLGLWALALIGLLRFRRPAIDVFLTFAPFLAFAWLMLDWYGASRLSMGFIPIVPLLAAQGLWLMGRRVPAAQYVAAFAIVAYFVQWTVPALREARSSDSPSVQAGKWIRQHVDPRANRVYVDTGVAGIADYELRGYRVIVVKDDFPASGERDPQHGWVMTEGATVLDSALNFRRERGRLWNIARHRYFEIAVVPLTNWVTFGDGWHEAENFNLDVWRWMSGHSVTTLPPIAGPGELRFRGHVPTDAVPRPPVLTVSVNGAVIDRFTVTNDDLDKRYVIDGRAGQPSVLTIDIDEVIHLPGDARILGFQLKGLSWRPVR